MKVYFCCVLRTVLFYCNFLPGYRLQYLSSPQHAATNISILFRGFQVLVFYSLTPWKSPLCQCNLTTRDLGKCFTYISGLILSMASLLLGISSKSYFCGISLGSHFWHFKSLRLQRFLLLRFLQLKNVFSSKAAKLYIFTHTAFLFQKLISLQPLPALLPDPIEFLLTMHSLSVSQKLWVFGFILLQLFSSQDFFFFFFFHFSRCFSRPETHDFCKHLLTRLCFSTIILLCYSRGDWKINNSYPL